MFIIYCLYVSLYESPFIFSDRDIDHSRGTFAPTRELKYCNYVILMHKDIFADFVMKTLFEILSIRHSAESNFTNFTLLEISH